MDGLEANLRFGSHHSVTLRFKNEGPKKIHWLEYHQHLLTYLKSSPIGSRSFESQGSGKKRQTEQSSDLLLIANLKSVTSPHSVLIQDHTSFLYYETRLYLANHH